jgi:hypothetical protein
MKCIFLVNLFFIFLTSCSSTVKTNFEDAAKKIRLIKLPFSDTCGNDMQFLQFSNDDSTLYKYLPNACMDSFKLAVAGKIAENEKITVLLLADTYGDYQMHYIATFTKKGELIAKFQLFKIGCSEDENYFGEAEYTITKDLLIYLRDSTVDYKRDSGGNIINKSIVSKSHNDIFRIADDGAIVKK